MTNSENTPGKELVFRNINISLEGNHVLKNITGVARSKEILGIFGPKGSGRTSLLATLSGHMRPYIGDVLLDGSPIEHTGMDIGYVPAVDLQLPTLTVSETLKFSALLKLPDSNNREVVYVLKHVTDVCGLDLYSDIMVQFALPFIRKRLSIACEMLRNPSALLLDDPVNGMEFKHALDILKILKHYAEKMDKIVVTSLTAGPSAFYSICNNHLFLYKGHIAYNGSIEQVTGFLTELELTPPLGYNPADWMIELLSEDTLDDRTPIQETILKKTYNKRQEPGWPCKSSTDKYPITSYNRDSSKRVQYTKNGSTTKQDDEVEVLINTSLKQNEFSSSFCHQFRVLLQRNFQNARRRILFPISIIQNAYILVLCVLIWWRPERVENTIPDRMGLFFFTIVQWAFFALLDAILTFPKEIKVINRERRFKQYRLSAFCLSKTISEIPLAILQPCVYMCVIYWVANLNGVLAFFASTGVLIIDVFAAQSIGLFIGAALQPPWTVSIVSLGLLSMMLWGGAFNTPPVWLQWGKYASYFFYGLQALIVLEFKDAPPIRCKPNSTIPVCNMIDSSTNKTFTEFDSELVLMVQNITWPVWQYVSVLIAIMIIMRVLWYIIMRRVNLQAS